MIRAVAAPELPALHALVETANRGDVARRGWTHEADLLGGQRTDLEALHEVFADPRQCIFVAVKAGALVGAITVIDRGEGVGGLAMLAVHPDHQTAGLGRQLLTAAEIYAASHFGSRDMVMTVIKQRPALIAYYTRRGYRLTGEEEPFPHGDERFGVAADPALVFVVLAKALGLEARA